MMRIVVLSFLTIICSTFACAGGLNVQELEEVDCPNGFYADRLANIDSVFSRLTKEGKMPQAVTMVVHKGEIVHHKSFGWRDVEAQIPCERTDIFRIASQTKAVAVVALMTLWERGMFQLDEPIKKYIPAFASPRVLVKYDKATKKYSSRKASRDITIRDLMTHTSGISYKGVHWGIMHDAKVPPLNTLESYTLEGVVNRLAKLPLAHDPGAEFTYSMNIEVLGRLAEILSGMAIDEFLRVSIFEPLGMVDTYFYLPEGKEDRLVSLYTYPRGGLCKGVITLYTNIILSAVLRRFFLLVQGLVERYWTMLSFARWC